MSGTVLETFSGVLHGVDGGIASITLVSAADGKVYHAQCSATKFIEKGIKEEDRFICKTVESAGETRIEIEAIPDVELTDEHVKAIRAKIAAGRRVR